MSASPIFLGKMWFNGEGQGWSESHYLNGGSAASAKANLQALIALRMPMLSNQVELVYANVSQLGIDRDSYLAISAATFGTDTVAADIPNNIENAILARLETSDGKHSNHYIHGVPDQVITGGLYQPTAGAGAWNTLLVAYLAGLVANTSYLKRDKSTTPPTLTLIAWGSSFNRGLTQHKVGRPFDMRRGRRNPA